MCAQKPNDDRNNFLGELREFRNKYRGEGRAVGAFVANVASCGHYLVNVRNFTVSRERYSRAGPKKVRIGAPKKLGVINMLVNRIFQRCLPLALRRHSIYRSAGRQEQGDMAFAITVGRRRM
mgnify:CR=1 FL=1